VIPSFHSIQDSCPDDTASGFAPDAGNPDSFFMPFRVFRLISG